MKDETPGDKSETTTLTKADKPTAQVFQLKSVPNQLAKADAPAVASSAFDPEDEFRTYYTSSLGSDTQVIEPPYNLRVLDRLSQENNALSPCIEAMVTNVAGTGYDFEKPGEDAETSKDDTNISHLRDFFGEPYPGQSFTTINKSVRRDLERTGNAYLEIICNPQDEPVFFRHVDAKMMRLVTLDNAVPVKRIVRRKGAEVTTTVMQRERRFCQLVNGVNMVYFAEFGASRDLNKKTGRWADVGKRLPATERASKIIHFTVLPDAHTPYGVPRWISQLPSILGSRRSEEYNLEFFENGGIPPVLILLQGGTLMPETKNALELKMGKGTAQAKNRVQVLEVMPSGGTLNSPNQARVTVERFGAERQDDSMFENYDEKCEMRVRRAFRLPPIFVGAADDYNFATAVASYAVAEAQVFKPERDEFDEVINIKLMRALGFKDYKMISKPLVIEDAALKLQGVQLAMSTKAVEEEDLLYEINEATGIDVRYRKPEPTPTMAVGPDGVPIPLKPGVAAFGGGGDDDDDDDDDTGKSSNVTKLKTKAKVQENGKGYTGTSVAKSAGLLALGAMTALRKRDLEGLDAYLKIADGLTDVAKSEFGRSLILARFGDQPQRVEADLTELTKATMTLMARRSAGCGHEHA